MNELAPHILGIKQLKQLVICLFSNASFFGKDVALPNTTKTKR